MEIIILYSFTMWSVKYKWKKKKKRKNEWKMWKVSLNAIERKKKKRNCVEKSIRKCGKSWNSKNKKKHIFIEEKKNKKKN